MTVTIKSDETGLDTVVADTTNAADLFSDAGRIPHEQEQSILPLERSISSDSVSSDSLSSSSPKLFTPNDLVSILSGAARLQYQNQITPELPLEKQADEKEVSLAEIYEWADKTGIEKEYVDKAMKMRCPPNAMRLRDIKKLGAKPNARVISGNYEKIILDTLQQTNQGTFTSKRISDQIVQFFEITEKIETYTTGFFRWKKENKRTIPIKRELAKIYINSVLNELNIYLKDPFFVHACGDILNKLNKEFKPRFNGIEISYDYAVDHLDNE